MKERVWCCLTNKEPEIKWMKYINEFILFLIFLNVVAVVLESVNAIHESAQGFFIVFEYISVAIFLAEYLLRLWSCTIDPRYRHPILGRLKWMFSPMALIDLIAILPSILAFVNSDFRSIRAVRLIRIFMLAKTGRYYRSVRLLGKVIVSRREELVVSFSMLVFMLIITSTLMFYVEHHAQPDAFSSIPAAMWWSVATLTTVGYGDVAPITAFGKLLGAFVAVIGIGLFALPTSILGSGFMEELEGGKKQRITCPHCQGEFDHGD